MEVSTTVRKGAKLGSGGFAHVFRAVQSDTQRVVALKQSRAPLRLKRPTLQHEAIVLRLLSGHPNIPDVYAYGRIEHFELISMQLLHRSLKDVTQEGGPLGVKTVANVACQMLDALQHLHSHCLVHRDIKPDNIMLQNADDWKLCLIDFGLTRRHPSSVLSASPTMLEDSDSVSDRPAHVFGTLLYASLNAHESEPQLAFRDDLESLGYTLLWLLKGKLPWSDYAKYGSRVGRIRQVFAQKKRHTGLSLATDLPVKFGSFVDYARSLSVDQSPNYEELRRIFEEVGASAINDDRLIPVHQDSRSQKLLLRSSCKLTKVFPVSTVRTEPPVEVGQIVLVKLNPAITGDGYTIREGHESSFIPDPFFDDPQWSTTYRPAVVAQVEWNERARRHTFQAICISRGLDNDKDSNTPSRIVPFAITSGTHTSGLFPAIRIEPEWPLEDSYFYAFKRPVKFYCLPSQDRVHSLWRITSSDCDLLLKTFTPSPDLMSEPQERQDLKSSNADIRHDARMRRWAGYCKLYAHVQPLTPTQLNDESIDWFSRRAWFDECVKIQRHKNMHGGFWWTGAWFPEAYHPKEEDVPDSYSESDYSMWGPRAERRESITLGTNKEDTRSVGDVLIGLTKIVGLENETEIGNIQK